MRRFGQLLLLLAGLVTFGPLMVSVVAGLVAMFAAFAGLHDLKASAGAICGAGALFFFAFQMMGGSELMDGLSSFQSNPQQTGVRDNPGHSAREDGG